MKQLAFALSCLALAAAMSSAAQAALSWSDVTAFWSFDETTGAHFHDTSGNGNHATFGASRNPKITAGECPYLDASHATRSGAGAGTGTGLQFGWACNVDDTIVTPLVDVPEAAMPTLPTDFAISFWLDAGAWASEYGLLTSYNDDTGVTGREWTVGIDNLAGAIPSALTIGCRDGSNVSWSTSLSGLSGYHHIIAQFTGENVTAMYVDGASVANSGVNSWLLPTTKGFVLGARERTKVSFPNSGATMDEFALINGTLTPADAASIVTNYQSGDDLGDLAGSGGLLEGRLNAYYKLDETLGTAVVDSSGNGHHGELRQWSLCAPKSVADATVAGKFGAAAEFGGSTLEEACQVVPSDLPAVGTDAFTTTFWLKLADWSAGGQVISWDNENTTEFSIVVGSGSTNGGRLFVHANSPGDGLKRGWVVLDEKTGGENLPNSEFAHIAVVVDADSNISVYVNGALVTLDGTDNSYLPTALNTVFIGGRATNGSDGIDVELPGVLDDLAIFQGALTQQEVQGVMTKGVMSVPEPGTFGLLLGLCLTLYVGRRFRR